MAGLVLDASVVLAIAFKEGGAQLAVPIMAMTADEGAAVPGIWHLEVGNSLLSAVRRGTITGEERHGALQRLTRLPIELDLETAAHAWRETSTLAERHRLTLYDASFLELSMRRSLPLATFDKALRRAAAEAGVALL